MHGPCCQTLHISHCIINSASSSATEAVGGHVSKRKCSVGKKRTWRPQAIAHTTCDACFLFLRSLPKGSIRVLRVFNGWIESFFKRRRRWLLSLAFRALPGIRCADHSVRRGHRGCPAMSGIQNAVGVVYLLFCALRSDIGSVGRRRRARAPRVSIRFLRRQRRRQRSGIW